MVWTLECVSQTDGHCIDWRFYDEFFAPSPRPSDRNRTSLSPRRRLQRPLAAINSGKSSLRRRWRRRVGPDQSAEGSGDTRVLCAQPFAMQPHLYQTKRADKIRLLLICIALSFTTCLADRDVTNSWLRQNRIFEYGEYGKKWAVFMFSKRKTALFEHQIRFSE